MSFNGDKLIELKYLRELLKPLGYKIKTKRNCRFTSMTYVHIESGKELIETVFVNDERTIWFKLFQFLDSQPYTGVCRGDERLTGHCMAERR